MAAEQQGSTTRLEASHRRWRAENPANDEATGLDSDAEWDEEEGHPASPPEPDGDAPRDMSSLKASYRAYAAGRPSTPAKISEGRERSLSPVDPAGSYGCLTMCRGPRARRPSRKATSSLRGLRDSWQRAVQNTGDLPTSEADHSVLRLMAAVEEEWNQPGGRAATVQINGIEIDLSVLQNDVRTPPPDSPGAGGGEGNASAGLLRTGGWPFRTNEKDAVRHLGREMLLQCLRVRGWRVDQSIQVALRFMRFRRNADWSLYFRAR